MWGEKDKMNGLLIVKYANAPAVAAVHSTLVCSSSLSRLQTEPFPLFRCILTDVEEKNWWGRFLFCWTLSGFIGMWTRETGYRGMAQSVFRVEMTGGESRDGLFSLCELS